MFDNIKADLERLTEGSITFRSIVRGLLSQGFQAVLTYRFFHWMKTWGIPSQPFRFIVERLVEIMTGISIPAECVIQKGLRIHHFGGIILHPSTRIGKNCTLHQGVTIGDRGGSGGAAAIGDSVIIGAGAKIIGGIHIGHHCRIGANAVVTKDMPDHSIAFVPTEIRAGVNKQGDAGDGA